MSTELPRASSHFPKTALLVLLIAITALVLALVAVFKTKPRIDQPPVLELDLTKPCRGNPWVGVLKDDVQSCPAGWSPLFDPAAAASEGDVQQFPNVELPPGLARFCVIPDPDKARGKKPGRRTAREELASYGDFEEIDQDCSVVGGASDTFFEIDDFDPALVARFRQEAGRSVRGAGGPPVRLVIVDSAPDVVGELTEAKLKDLECPPGSGYGNLECSAHGWALGKIARDLLCDDSGENCTAEIRTRRALLGTYEIQKRGLEPKRAALTVAAPASGGRFGEQTDLARAIWRSVAAWRNEMVAARKEKRDEPKLILNLSVGWESVYGDFPAVRAAIEDAVCRGALVLAAAGNRIAGPESLAETPILPGAWEREPAPSENECRKLIEESFLKYLRKEEPPEADQPQQRSGYGQTGSHDEEYRPLVHAVGGVQHDGRPMSSSRPGATPRIVAYGDHVSAMYSDGKRREMLTGTSVSTLVVAAAAAAEWVRKSDQESFEVMQALWATGEPVSQPVDFCLWNDCPEARRVYLESPASLRSLWPEGRPSVRDAGPNLKPEPSDFKTLMILRDCAPQALRHGDKPKPGSNLCPQRWAFDIADQAFVYPQPGSNHNPTCTATVNSPGTLYLEFDPRYRIDGIPTELSDLTLITGDQAYRLTDKKLLLGEPGGKLEQLVFENFIEETYPLYLAATVNGKYATITPILLVKGPRDPPVMLRLRVAEPEARRATTDVEGV